MQTLYRTLIQVAHSDAPIFITGEMSHHDLLKAQSSGCTVILVGHTETERCYLPELSRRIREELGASCPKIIISRQDRPPLRSG